MPSAAGVLIEAIGMVARLIERNKLTEDLIALIGEAGLLALAKEFGGRRLYIPHSLDRFEALEGSSSARLVAVLGAEMASKLISPYSGNYIRVPLAIDLRVKELNAKGWSSGRIATALRMTETGVERLFKRLREDGKRSPAARKNQPKRRAAGC